MCDRRRISSRGLPRPGICHGEFALRIVIFVKAFSARQQERSLEVPPRVGAELESSTRQKRLRKRILRVLHSPRSQILRQYCRGNSAAKFLLEADIARSVEIFLHQRVE